MSYLLCSVQLCIAYCIRIAYKKFASADGAMAGWLPSPIKRATVVIVYECKYII